MTERVIAPQKRFSLGVITSNRNNVVLCHSEIIEFNIVFPQGFAVVADAIGCPYQLLKAEERLGL